MHRVNRATFIYFSIILIILSSFERSSAQCSPPGPTSPPSAPSVTATAGPGLGQFTFSVSNVTEGSSPAWISNNQVNWTHYTDFGASDDPVLISNRGSNDTWYVAASNTNSCGTTWSSIVSVTTYDLGPPPISARAGATPGTISYKSHYIGTPPYYFLGVVYAYPASSGYTNAYYNFYDEGEQTSSFATDTTWFFYAGTPINSTEWRYSDIIPVHLNGDQNLGDPGCPSVRSGPVTAVGGPVTAVGDPVNVINGNMFMSETDYNLPGPGENINLTRNYNNQLATQGLFGVGWTTQFDENLTLQNSRVIRIGMPDGRGVYFARPGTSGAFTANTVDGRGEIVANTDGTYTLTFKDGRVHKFNSSGQLLWLKDRNGNQTTLNYTSGVITGVTDPVGRTLSFTVSDGLITAVSDTTGTVATYTYNWYHLTSVTYADTSKHTYGYYWNSVLSRAYISSVTDKLNNVLEAHDYDNAGHATSSERDGGVWSYDLDYSHSDYTTVTDGLGRVSKYYFDPTSGRNVVKKIEGVCGCGGGGTETTEFTYDTRFNLVKKVDALSNETTYTYNSDGDLTGITDPIGTQSFTYNSLGEVLTHTDRMSGVTTNTYDSHGNLLTTTDPLSHTTTLDYTSIGLLASVEDARENTTAFTYDASGRLITVTDANDNDTTLAYNARAQVTSVTNALSQTTEFEYDSNNRLDKVTYPDTSEVNIEYDLAGRKTSVTDELGHATTYAYDGAYRLTGITDALSHTTSFDYDTMSNITSQTDALGNVTNLEYDDFNRLKKIKYPVPSPSATPRLEESFTYDKLGNVKTKVDTAGHTTSYDYDAASRLTKITDALSHETQFTYNARSQTTKVKDALNQEYTFTYDALGRELTQTRNSTTMTFTYDVVGNRATRTDYNGNVSSYTYDVLNRLTAIAYTGASGENTSYTYDVLSRVLTATNAAGTVTFTYDNRGRLATEEDVFGHDLEYTYDAAGNRTGLELDTAAHTGYAYDYANRLTTLTDESSNNFTFAYDNANKLTSRVAPNGVTSSYEYDGMSRLKRLKHYTSSTTLYDDQFAYNSANQISQIAGLSTTKNYTYDNINRLTGVSVGGSSVESYTYDALGNRTASHLSSSYTTGSFNRLTATNSASYSYNSNGSMTGKTVGSTNWTYGWDRENRMISAGDGINAASYVYDALGRRVKRTQGSDVQKYTHDGNDVVLDDVNTTLTKYQNGLGIDNKLKQVSGGTSKYFLADNLESTKMLANSSGSSIDSNTYDSFGNATNGSFTSRYQFTGREMDSLSSLQFSRERFFDHQLGRFISQDPIGFNGGDVNLYGYVQNQPVDTSDPHGLWPFSKRYPTSGTLPGTSIPYRMDMRQEPFPNMHVYWPDGSQTVINHKGGWERDHGGKPLAKPPRSYRDSLEPVSDNFLCRVKLKFPGGFSGIFFTLYFVDGAFNDYELWNEAQRNTRSIEQQMCDDYGDSGPYVNTAIGILPNPYQGCKGT